MVDVNYSKVQKGKEDTHLFSRIVGLVAVVLFLATTSVAISTSPYIAVNIDPPEISELQQSAERKAGLDNFPSFKQVALKKGFDYTATRKKVQTAGADDGVYAVDYNRDGWTDLLATGGNKTALFKNTGGEFERVESFPEFEKQVYGAHFFDMEGDGDPDLAVFPSKGHPIYLENTESGFEKKEIGFEGIELGPSPRGAVTAFYDDNRCPDMFVFDDLRPALKGKYGHFYMNDCESLEKKDDIVLNGRISGKKGTPHAYSFTDFTGDGIPDLHIGQDLDYDDFYKGTEEGFVHHQLSRNTHYSAMSSEVGDINRDGKLEIFVTNINDNNLLVNRNNMFRDAVFNDSLNIPVSELRVGDWGWAAIMADFDNDRDMDIFHANSHGGSYGRNPMWENTDDGVYSFEKKNSELLGFRKDTSRGAAQIDFDRDGDLDIALAVTPEHYSHPQKFFLYENQGTDGNWLQFRLAFENGQTALGARATVHMDDRNLTRVSNSKADMNSQDSRTLHVGLGKKDKVKKITVEWPTGETTEYRNIDANQRLVIRPSGIEKQ